MKSEVNAYRTNESNQTYTLQQQQRHIDSLTTTLNNTKEDLRKARDRNDAMNGLLEAELEYKKQIWVSHAEQYVCFYCRLIYYLFVMAMSVSLFAYLCVCVFVSLFVCALFASLFVCVFICLCLCWLCLCLFCVFVCLFVLCLFVCVLFVSLFVCVVVCALFICLCFVCFFVFLCSLVCLSVVVRLFFLYFASLPVSLFIGLSEGLFVYLFRLSEC